VTPLVEPVDLRSITRESSRVITTIKVIDVDDQDGHDHKFPWLTFGEPSFRYGERRDHATMEIGARLGKGATDFEHDSAWAFRFDLVGVEIKALWGLNHFVGLVKPCSFRNHQFCDFHVPGPGYNPLTHPKTVRCTDKHCGPKGHPIVPQGYYVPPVNPDLHEKLSGRWVEVVVALPDRKR